MKGVLFIFILAAGGAAAAYYYDDSLRARIDAILSPAISAAPVSAAAGEPGVPAAVFALRTAREKGGVNRTAWGEIFKTGLVQKFRLMSGDGELTIHEILRAEKPVMPEMWLFRTDTNRDGGVDSAELAADAGFFAMADGDNSGKVSAAEWWDLYSRLEWQWLQKSDSDGSGGLNEQEYLRGKKVAVYARNSWNTVDTDGDGVLTKDEIADSLAAHGL